jgi:O-acetyl-ADP-ribose deacetylase (regulator of RNase III)
MSQIEFVQGDLLKTDVEALVNTVNCVGVMGRGIALQFKQAFPENYKAYKTACERGEVQPGRMFITERTGLGLPRYLINFPTKRHWKGKSRFEDIESGLQALVADIERLSITSIALPPLGAGLGGLSWSEVRARIEEALGALPHLRVIVFEPGDAPPVSRNVTKAPSMTPGRAALVGLMDRYLGGMLDPFVSLLEVQKLMYFLQEAGQDLRLTYQPHYYGPYAPDLRHVLRRLEGHLITGYADGGEDPGKPLELVVGAREDAAKFLVNSSEVAARFERVTLLVDGFETAYGMELLSTVHFAATHLGASTCEGVIDAVHAWSERKKQFTSAQITLAWNILSKQGWLNSKCLTILA